jgi:hypothetical protein
VAYDLPKEFEVVGTWHVAEHPERAISGTLRYAPERCELHLSNVFRPLRGAISVTNSVEQYLCLHGVTQHGEAVTILNAWRLGSSINFSSGGLVETESLHVPLLFMGAHIYPDTAFHKIEFRVPGMQVWHGRKTITSESGPAAESPGKELSYRINRPPTEEIRVSAIDSTLEWYVGANYSNDNFSKASVEIAAWVAVRPTAPKELDWYLTQLKTLTTMLTFLAGTPMSPDRISAAVDESHRRVSVLVPLTDVGYCTHTRPSQFFVDRGTMGVDFEKAINNWFEKYDRIKMPSRLAMSIFASDKLWRHVEFLSLMQALEGFHRALFEGLYMSGDEYAQIRESLTIAIPANTSPSHRASLLSRLKYGNEISLRKRLTELTDLIPEPIRESLLGPQNGIPQAWIDTRNYYTHWDESLRANVLDGQEMYYASVRLRHLVQVLYLLQLEMPEEALKKALGNSSSISQHLLQLNAIDRQRINPQDASGVVMTVTRGDPGAAS